jgi:hypothetical protein
MNIVETTIHKIQISCDFLELKLIHKHVICKKKKTLVTCRLEDLIFQTNEIIFCLLFYFMKEVQLYSNEYESTPNRSTHLEYHTAALVSHQY